LYYRGRKKDLIVTAEGLNVFPDDVENVLRQLPEIRDSTVVGVMKNGHEVVHAALILKEPAADPEELIRRANEQLEAHQRIKGWSIWPDSDFPRTPSTLKVRRNEVARMLSESAQPQRESQPDLSAMSSLERVELLSELEDRLQTNLDEEAFARLSTSEDLEQWLKGPVAEREGAQVELTVAEWARSRPIRCLRAACQQAFVLPLFRHYLPLTVVGLENLRSVEPPLIFAANHTSNLDAVGVLAALPSAWRKRLAPAMAKDQFRPHFEPHEFSWLEVWKWRVGYILASILFNTYPLPQMMAGARRALKYTGELVTRGYCPLVFPEGQRTRDGQMLRFRPGIGMMAVQLRVPIVPIHIEGLFEVYPIDASWPKRGPVRLTIGKPMEFPPDAKYEDVAMSLQTTISQLRASGASE
jgi:long-chain acyl-CoA synthetase